MQIFHKIFISLTLIVVSFISFFYSIKYISYNGYTFNSSINGEQLLVVNGKDHIGEVISINENELRLKNESIDYEIESESNGCYNLKFCFEDGIEFNAEGFSPEDMIFIADSQEIGYNSSNNIDEPEAKKRFGSFRNNNPLGDEFSKQQI